MKDNNLQCCGNCANYSGGNHCTKKRSTRYWNVCAFYSCDNKDYSERLLPLTLAEQGIKSERRKPNPNLITL